MTNLFIYINDKNETVDFALVEEGNIGSDGEAIPVQSEYFKLKLTEHKLSYPNYVAYIFLKNPKLCRVITFGYNQKQHPEFDKYCAGKLVKFEANQQLNINSSEELMQLYKDIYKKGPQSIMACLIQLYIVAIGDGYSFNIEDLEPKEEPKKLGLYAKLGGGVVTTPTPTSTTTLKKVEQPSIPKKGIAHFIDPHHFNNLSKEETKQPETPSSSPQNVQEQIATAMVGHKYPALSRFKADDIKEYAARAELTVYGSYTKEDALLAMYRAINAPIEAIVKYVGENARDNAAKQLKLY